MTGGATEGKGRGSRRRLDLGTRLKVLRLARRGQRHPKPEVSLKAHQWADDRLRVAPLKRELLALIGMAVIVAALGTPIMLALKQPPGLLPALLALSLPGMCAWTVYMHRRVEDVARLNAPQGTADD